MWIINKDNLHKIKNLDFTLPLILGVFLSLANPPFSFPYIIVVVLVVIGFYWLKKNYSPKKSFFFGFLFGFGYFTFSLVWIIEPFLVEPNLTVILAPFALIFLSGVLSFFWGCAFFFSSYKNDFKNKKISLFKLAICLSLAEILRSHLFTGFPWVLLGLAFIDTPISQVLSIFGPYWLTSIIIILCLIIPTGKTGILLSIIGFSLLNIYGLYRDNNKLDDEINKQIRIIQPNILQKNKWKKDLEEVNFSKLIKLSNKNSKNVDILIWPETSVPFFCFFGNVFPYSSVFLPKTKMVRVVHRNLLYNTKLKKCDPKMESCRETEILRRWESLNFRIEVQNWTFEGCFETKMILKHILEVPALIPAQFPY